MFGHLSLYYSTEGMPAHKQDAVKVRITYPERTIIAGKKILSMAANDEYEKIYGHESFAVYQSIGREEHEHRYAAIYKELGVSKACKRLVAKGILISCEQEVV